MFHYFESITNTSGDALIGYYVQALDSSSGDVADIYADSSGTAINTVSGVDNMAVVDSNGNVSFYIPGGTYDLRIYATDATTFVLAMDDVQMVDFATLSTTGIGYAVGAGGTFTQSTSKSTTVDTGSVLSGQITTHNAALAANTTVSFFMNNSNITSSDLCLVQLQSVVGGAHNAADYTIRAGTIATGGVNRIGIYITNTTGGSLSEQIVLNFAIIKGAIA